MYIYGLAIILGVEDEGGCKRLLAEQLDELGALEGHLRQFAAQLVLDHLLDAAQRDPLRVVDEHPEQDQAQVIHVLDFFAVGARSVAVCRRGLAKDGLDRLQHLPVVHDESSVLDGELDDVADFSERVACKEGEVALHQLPRHAVAAPGKGVLAIEELRQLLPQGLVVRVVRRVDIYPTFEPRWFAHQKNGNLVRVRCLVDQKQV
mmetsp:Transcript_104115/g.294971  ORF Transcript_104115/g.294971 Transcript_104115/m.294971 type:complete len:205 (-) Transcript_104115:1614-2228(-)